MDTQGTTPQPHQVVYALVQGQYVPVYADDTEAIRRLIALGAHIPMPQQERTP